ncbi:hypothetical protein [Sphingomonas sp.]|uniref:hypothetical protein n=1 Tax=Sphingomonas sp. TaxID=28214 RepID=UPI003B00FC22
MLTALRNWKLIVGGLALAALGFALLLAKADARHWHKQADTYRLQIEVARREAADAAAVNATRTAQAADAFAARTAALQPLIVRSTDTVRTYAETPAGRAACLDADRVRGLDALDASLAAPVPARSGTGAMHSDPGTSPAGR